MRMMVGLPALVLFISVANADQRLLPCPNCPPTGQKSFEFLGWQGIANKAACSAAIGSQTNGLRLRVATDDLAVLMQFVQTALPAAQMPGREQIKLSADFADEQNKAIATVERDIRAPFNFTANLDMTPYERMMNLLLVSDSVTLYGNGVPKWTLSLSKIRFDEVYHHLRLCAMKAAIDAFDNAIGSPSAQQWEQDGLRLQINDAECTGAMKFGWCLSRAPGIHGARGDTLMFNAYHPEQYHPSPNVAVPVIERPALSYNGAQQRLSASELYDRVLVSSYVIRAQNKGAKFASVGSGVAVGPHTLVTNCHVVMQQSKKEKKYATDASGVIVKDNEGNPTELEYSDWDHPFDQNYEKISVLGPVPEKPWTPATGENILWSATIVEPHCEADIVILKTAADLYPINGIREFDDINKGESVYAVGAPQSIAGTVTPGIVSNKMSQMKFNSIMPKVDLVLSSAAITPGNSGVGLFDEYGNLIALNESVPKELNGLYIAVAVFQIMINR